MIRSFVAVLVLIFLVSSTTWAKPEPVVVVSPLDSGDQGPLDKAPAAVAAVDTVYLMGGPGDLSGTFDDGFGGPDWHGWTGEDGSISLEFHWHTSDYLAHELPGKEPGNHAMYCGDETIAACDSLDVEGGYGNGWLEEIEWRHAVADTSQSVTVRLTGLLRHDTEPGYDYVYLMVNRGDDNETLATWESAGTDSLDYSVTLNPGDYTGPDSDEIRLAWRFKSDGGWSDVDCQWPTSGACQIDDLAVEVDSVQITFDDFEPGNPVNWTEYVLPGVGDFSNLRSDLPSLDPCSPVKSSYQANFIDDGIVVPGTGGTPCVTWCYGPGGWILNHNGGLMNDPSFHIINRVVSPPIAWPAGKDGGELAYDVFAHIFFMNGCAGIFPFWWVRSTDSADPADLENAPWVSRGLGIDNQLGTYMRRIEPLSDLLVPDRQYVQVALGIYEFGFSSGFDGPNGTPAPYYDNVQIRTWDPQGPELALNRSNRFGDGNPEQGFLNHADLASNWCRLDGVLKDYYGVRVDSLRVDSFFMRHDATSPAPAELHWVMECNPVFDRVRPVAPGGDGLLRGSVAGVGRFFEKSTYRGPGATWAFDLPDSGWFYPGDRLRWYVTAGEEVDGDIRTSVFPADTTEVLDFSPGVRYHAQAEISALPSVGTPQAGSFQRPSWLFVDYTYYAESGTPWIEALEELGMVRGIDFDVMRPYSFDELDWPADFLDYDGMILTSGSRPWNNLSQDGDPGDAERIKDWLDSGDRRLLMAGDQLVTGSRGWAYSLFTQIGVQLLGPDITDVNGGVRELEASPVTGNGILPDNTIWEIVDSCPDSYDTEVIGTTGSGLVLAHLNPEGSDLDQQAAVIASGYLEPGDRTVVMPFDLARIGAMTVGKAGQLSSQASFLNHLMTWLNTGGVSAVDDVPGVREVAISAHPNPFNPATTISFALPRAGAVTLEVFDIQGRKVRTLIDDQRFEAGRHEQPWDGRDEGGRGTSSGVYFYRFTAGSEERVGKLTLLK